MSGNPRNARHIALATAKQEAETKPTGLVAAALRAIDKAKP